jgi:hypothetical protein
MHITRRINSNCEMYKLKGDFSAPALSQLKFIMSVVAGTKPVQFDFRRVGNASSNAIADLLRDMCLSTPSGKSIRLSGFQPAAIRQHSKDGVPQDLFV